MEGGGGELRRAAWGAVTSLRGLDIRRAQRAGARLAERATHLRLENVRKCPFTLLRDEAVL